MDIWWLFKTQRTNKYQIRGTSQYCTIIPETLGQYTEVCDVYKTKLYDGDIIYFKEENMRGLVNFRYGGWYITWYGFVQVCNGIGWEEKYTECNEKSLYSVMLDQENQIPYEKIGNIIDNPELLKG